MRNLPQITVKNLNLDATSERALTTSIDDFRFINIENSRCIGVFIGQNEQDHIDSIYIHEDTLTAKELERIALTWISKHVNIDLGGVTFK